MGLQSGKDMLSRLDTGCKKIKTERFGTSLKGMARGVALGQRNRSPPDTHYTSVKHFPLNKSSKFRRRRQQLPRLQGSEKYDTRQEQYCMLFDCLLRTSRLRRAQALYSM
jgi:hypothetical protein